MKILAVIGLLTVLYFLVKSIIFVYRKFVPRKYTWENCPGDHDTLARMGAEHCHVCGAYLGWDREDDEDDDYDYES